MISKKNKILCFSYNNKLYYNNSSNSSSNNNKYILRILLKAKLINLRIHKGM